LTLATGIAQMVLVDGLAKSISDNIALGVWRSLGTRDAGEVFGEF